jgi:murein DD-endopeptidase MepM/ murein hydrolase activator NlpD
MRNHRRFTLFLAAAIGTTFLARGAESPDANLARCTKPYSNQQIVWLNANETYTFKLKDGSQRNIRLISVREHRDSVVNLMRRAEVRLEIDGRPLDLVCEPYQMPVETAGLRIQADSTAGWGNVPKQVQLSLWDAKDPIVDVKKFVYPIRNHLLFSHGMQAHNEPVHLGAGDDDPAGQRFYHDYGFDTAGFEGREDVVSAVEGKIVHFWPSREDLCSAVVQDRSGLNWEYAHLKSVEPEIVLNAQVARGQKIGLLGKSGPSGNFSHLHLGTYLTMRDLETDHRNTRLNLYPWLVTAYRAQHPKALFAVARPHHIALTGEKVVLDGSHSLAWGGNKIASYRWVFPDGQTVNNRRAEKTFDRPGAYVAELRIKDDRGAEDVDFCQIKVFTKGNPEKGIPHIYMSYVPTEAIHLGQPVRFRFWLQGSGAGPIRVDFDDGTHLENYQPYTEFQHRFKTPGLHVLTARCDASGKPIVQKLKVVVDRKK